MAAFRTAAFFQAMRRELVALCRGETFKSMMFQSFTSSRRREAPDITSRHPDHPDPHGDASVAADLEVTDPTLLRSSFRSMRGHSHRLTRQVAAWLVLMAMATLALARVMVVMLGKRTARPSRVVANWTMFVGDEILRDTFLTVVNMAMEDRMPGLQHERQNNPLDAFTQQSFRDAAFLCNKPQYGGGCALYFLSCANFQLRCEDAADAKGPLSADNSCDGDPLNPTVNTIQCSRSQWKDFARGLHLEKTEFAITYHYAPRAIARKQPATVKQDALWGEPDLKKSSLKEALWRFSVALPTHVTINGCHNMFLTQGSRFNWDAYNWKLLLEIYLKMVTNNIRVFREAGFKGPIVYQSCTPLDCAFLLIVANNTRNLAGMSYDSCVGTNFQFQQLNKLLLQLFREKERALGDVRYADVFTPATLGAGDTCNGERIACYALDGASPVPGIGTVGLAVQVTHPSITTAWNTTNALARAVAYVTLAADLPPSLMAEPEQCPCDARSYIDSDLGAGPSQIDDNLAWLTDDSVVT